MSEPLITIENFSKSYGKETAVEGLSLEVQPGEVLGLLGPNGAGKTTTLRALAGIIPPTSGKLHIGGYDIVASPLEAKRRLALIPDDPRLFDTLTVWEHLEFTAAAYGLRDFHVHGEQLLDQFQLLAKRDALAQELSRGMRQKVAIVCAYLHDPVALMFDEPLTGLDPHSIEILQASIRQRAQDGAAVIISSHLLNLVESHCTHVLILDCGVVRFHGPLAAARQRVDAQEPSDSLQELFFQLTRASSTEDIQERLDAGRAEGRR